MGAVGICQGLRFQETSQAAKCSVEFVGGQCRNRGLSGGDHAVATIAAMLKQRL